MLELLAQSSPSSTDTLLKIAGIAVSGVGALLVGVNLVWTYAVAAKANKIGTLEAELKSATTKAIEEKLATLRAEQAAPINVMNQQIAFILRRLEVGEDRFTKLEEKDHALQVEVLKALSDLKDVVATKDDLNRLREELGR